jgi:hypothetical protein
LTEPTRRGLPRPTVNACASGAKSPALERFGNKPAPTAEPYPGMGCAPGERNPPGHFERDRAVGDFAISAKHDCRGDCRGVDVVEAGSSKYCLAGVVGRHYRHNRRSDNPSPDRRVSGWYFANAVVTKHRHNSLL